MVKKKKQKTYPSQERYYENNPSVTFRLPKELKQKLEEIAKREGKTVGQYVREFLEGIVSEKEKENKSYWKGVNDGRVAWQIWVNCSRCREPICITPNSEAHEDIKRMRWLCEYCGSLRR